jgi:hypothetical protein
VITSTAGNDRTMATKKVTQKKKIKTGSYKTALESIEIAIAETQSVLYDAQKNGDKLAAWGLTFVYDDLIKQYHRLGNIRNTIKGNRE